MRPGASIGLMLVAGLMAAGCLTPDSGATDELVKDCPAEIEDAWPSACSSDYNEPLTVSDCSTAHSILRVPAANSQVPAGWSPYLYEGQLAQLTVVNHRCDDWLAAETSLGAGSLTFIGEYVSQRNDSEFSDRDVYVYQALTDNPLLEHYFGTNGFPMGNGEYAYPDRPTDPHSFQVTGEGIDYSTTISYQQYAVESTSNWHFFWGNASNPVVLDVDATETSTNLPAQVIQATGGVFDDALPSPAWTSTASPWITDHASFTRPILENGE